MQAHHRSHISHISSRHEPPELEVLGFEFAGLTEFLGLDARTRRIVRRATAFVALAVLPLNLESIFCSPASPQWEKRPAASLRRFIRSNARRSWRATGIVGIGAAGTERVVVARDCTKSARFMRYWRLMGGASSGANRWIVRG